MNLDRVVMGWTNGASREWESIEDDLHESIERAESGPARLAVEGWGHQLGRVAIATPERTRAAFGSFVAVVDQAVVDEDQRVAPNGAVSFALINLLDVANALDSVGLSVADASRATMKAWLPRMNAKRDDVRAHYYWTSAFAALALDEAVAYQRAAALDSTAAIPFVPGQTFQFNMQGLLRHLAGAIAHGARLDDVMPAWEDLLQSFYALEDAHSIDNGTLLWIARIVFHRIGGCALGDVARKLRESSWALANVAS
jgi:hypothetical protein